MKKNDGVGIYIHVPFCEKKCIYCAFLSFNKKNNVDLSAYVDTVCREIKLWGKAYWPIYVDTIFLGGGTPSLLSPSNIGAIMESLMSSFILSSEAEITMESNPNSLSLGKAEGYRASGINRLSIGVQSFDNSVLKNLGRLHRADQAVKAFNIARKAGFENINLDLMFGLPEQSMAQWQESVKSAVSLNPDHLSLYSLQLEEGSALYDAYKDGIINLPDEKIDRAMYHWAQIFLRNEEYPQYEISNFGYKQCRHNMRYWSMGEYLGFGPGASSYFKGLRYKNYSNIKAWTNGVISGLQTEGKVDIHEDSPSEAMSIYCFTALRKSEGIVFEEFKNLFCRDFHMVYEELLPSLHNWEKKGMLNINEDRMTLTGLGMDCSNMIMMMFV